MQSGELKIKSGEVITFPEGILGFEEYCEYLLCQPQKDLPFLQLQAIAEPNVAFILLDPKLLMPSYTLLPTPGDLEKLELDTLEQALILAIVNVGQETINLQGPLVINWQKHFGFQFILPEADGWRKYPLTAKQEGG